MNPQGQGSGTSTGGPSSAFGPGLGLYDSKSSPSGIETAAKWLGSSSSIKYADDFIDATNWSNISAPWQLPNWKGSPYTLVWGVPMLPCGGSNTQCPTNVSDYNQVANGGADGMYDAGSFDNGGYDGGGQDFGGFDGGDFGGGDFGGDF